MGRFNNADIPDEDAANTPFMEKYLRTEFRNMLMAANMPLAVKNFDALMVEKSGEKARRNDGTVGWYHELIPVLMMIELARRGNSKDSGGFDLKDLEPYGGLEVLICTHLRHDSVEDHISRENFKKDLQQMVADIRLENPNYNVDKAQKKVQQIVDNVDLMSQRRLYHPDGSKVIVDGKHAKEDIKVYTLRMLEDEKTNPIVYMLKLCDIIVNSSTMFGANKFSDPQKRLQKFNNYEDMFGQRYGFSDHASEKWPRFENAINTLDCTMAFILFAHFRYMESVDLAYPDKTPMGVRIGTKRSLEGALRFENMAEGLNPIHNFLKRMMHSVDPAEDPIRAGRLAGFLQDSVVPTVSRYPNRFPYLSQTPSIFAEARPAPPVVH